MTYNGINYDWVVANVKDLGKMTLQQLVGWFEYPCVIFECERVSSRGAREMVYVIGAHGTYPGSKGGRVRYITDTGKGFGGTGIMNIINIYNNETVKNIIKSKKHSVWVFK